jgi:hypothetical protein
VLIMPSPSSWFALIEVAVFLLVSGCGNGMRFGSMFACRVPRRVGIRRTLSVEKNPAVLLGPLKGALC